MYRCPKVITTVLLSAILCACGGGAGGQASVTSSAEAATPPGPSAAVPTGEQGASAPVVPNLPVVVVAPTTGVAQFGVDADGNGVPDRLDTVVAKSEGGVDTKAAALAYFALVSKLSAKALANEALTEKERQQVFRSLDCYAASATADGSRRLSLDDQFMQDRRAFRGMHALMAALNGTAAPLSMSKETACAAAN